LFSPFTTIVHAPCPRHVPVAVGVVGIVIFARGFLETVGGGPNVDAELAVAV
jgi:hypothetical protein